MLFQPINERDTLYHLPQILPLVTSHDYHVIISTNHNLPRHITLCQATTISSLIIYAYLRMRETHYIRARTHNFNQSAIDTSCHVTILTHHNFKRRLLLKGVSHTPSLLLTNLRRGDSGESAGEVRGRKFNEA